MIENHVSQQRKTSRRKMNQVHGSNVVFKLHMPEPFFFWIVNNF